MHADPRTFVPPMMFNNCGNMGLPLAVLAYGAAGFSAMVALFTISNLLHFTLGVWIIDHHARFGNLLRNPMVWSTFAGFAFALTHPPMPEWADRQHQAGRRRADPDDAAVARRAAARVRWDDWRLGVVGGLVCPVTGLAMALLLAPAAGPRRDAAWPADPVRRLPPAVLNFMVAEQFRQEPHKVASIVLIGNVLSVIFVPIGLALALL